MRTRTPPHASATMPFKNIDISVAATIILRKLSFARNHRQQIRSSTKEFCGLKRTQAAFPLALLSPPSDIQLSTSHHGDCEKVILIMLSIRSHDPRASPCFINSKPITQSHIPPEDRRPSRVRYGQSLTGQVGEGENTSQYPSNYHQGDRKDGSFPGFY